MLPALTEGEADNLGEQSQVATILVATDLIAAVHVSPSYSADGANVHPSLTGTYTVLDQCISSRRHLDLFTRFAGLAVVILYMVYIRTFGSAV